MKKTISILLAFLMTGLMLLFCFTFLARELIVPAMDGNGTQAGDELIREEQQLAQKRIAKLADIYGFRAEPVAAVISEDIVRDLNDQSALWWKSILKRGKTGDAIRWKTDDVEQAIGENLISTDKKETEGVAAAGAEAIRTSVIRTVLPVRQEIMELGLYKAGEKLDLPNLISFFMGIPWAALALCVLLAGLIALVWSGQTIREALPYIGGSLGAAALVMIAAAVLFLSIGIQPMIREASESLAFIYQRAVSRTMLLAGILTVIMAAGSILCMTAGSKKDQAA